MQRTRTVVSGWTPSDRGEMMRAGKLTLSENFGKLTFGRKTMAERLSKSVYEKMLRTMEGRDPIPSEIADEVAQSMKDWAVSLGATHFCHWFQPLRGTTAEKHDTFLSLEKDGSPIERFSGQQLIQGEPDASSFPSGGMRSTFEARGYTAWDPTSPSFVLKNGRAATLVIPSVYVSFTGEVLDRKTPLLRSLQALEDRALKLVKAFGDSGVRYVRATMGPEQEYFLVPKELYVKRPDLLLAGRTLMGAAPARHQQMEDHYFGEIKPRVLNFMADVEAALVERGIPAKTRHNEVAPSQFELAVLYEEANLAVDHNLQAMEIMRRIADDHGLALLLHEKPFAGINGSGKHMNWSLADSEGRNLLEPGPDAEKNVRFLAFLAAILYGADNYGGLLRAMVADAGNDHRLGANEAPPAIMSVFLGGHLNSLLDAIEKGEKLEGTGPGTIDHGLKHLPKIAKDNSDRNRTSPIAFTGDKFEFRAVGSSQSCAAPATAMALLLAKGLDVVLDRIAAHKKKGLKFRDAAFAAIRETVKESKRVRFEGNNYAGDWHKEAKKRGLEAAADTPSALPTLVRKDVVELYEGYKVLRESELRAAMEIRLEAYAKTKEIELRLLNEMAHTVIAPALLRHIGQAGEAYRTLLAARGKGRAVKKRLDAYEKLLEAIYAGIAGIDAVLKASDAVADVEKKARLLADKGVKALDALRAACDEADAAVECRFWPLPKYRELLFAL